MTSALQPIYPWHLRVRGKVWSKLAGTFLHLGWRRPSLFCMERTLVHWEKLAAIQRGEAVG